jgi:hypothetical protein
MNLLLFLGKPEKLLPGHLIGALKAAKGDFGADRLDDFDMVDSVLLRPEFLRLFLLKIYKEGIFLECMVFRAILNYRFTTCIR